MYFSSPACQSYTFYILLGPRLAQISTYLANTENQIVLVTAKLREAFLFEVLNSFGIFLITFAILKNPFANPLKKVANLLMEFAMFLS